MSTDLTSLIADEMALARVVSVQMKDNRWRDLTPLAIAKAILTSDWLAEHDREVAAEAVARAADETDDNCLYGWTFPNGVLREWDHEDEKAEEVTVHEWLHDRAQAIREGRA